MIELICIISTLTYHHDVSIKIYMFCYSYTKNICRYIGTLDIQLYNIILSMTWHILMLIKEYFFTLLFFIVQTITCALIITVITEHKCINFVINILCGCVKTNKYDTVEVSRSSDKTIDKVISLYIFGIVCVII